MNTKSQKKPVIVKGSKKNAPVLYPCRPWYM